LQDAKTGNPDAFSLLQMPGDQADEIVEENLSHPFREVVLFGHTGRQVLKRN
jgi:hypothetical protein